MHRSQKKLVLVNGKFAGESGIDTNLYEGGRRGTKRMFEEYDNGKIPIHLYKTFQYPKEDKFLVVLFNQALDYLILMPTL